MKTVLERVKSIWLSIKPELPGGRTALLTAFDIAIALMVLLAGAWLLHAALLPDERVPVSVQADGYTLDCRVFPTDSAGSLIAELGIKLRQDDAVSCNTSAPVYEGMSVEISRAFPVAVRSHQSVKVLSLVSGTVGDALRLAGVTYDVNDELSYCAFEDVAPGMKIVHTDVQTEYATAYKTLNYKELAEYDEDVYNDTEPVLLQSGANGTKQVTQRIVIKDGVKVSSEVVDQVVITPATDEITKYGTKIHYQTNYYGDTRIYKKKPTAGKDGWIEMTMDYITAYSSDGKTATGSHTRFGTIAVNPHYIPYYTEIWVPGYGYGKALDTGAFRKYTNPDGSLVNQLDLFFVRESDARRWGRKRKVTVLVRMG